MSRAPGTVLTTFNYRVKDATSGKHLTTMANNVNTVWNYCNEISTRSAQRGTRWVTKTDLENLTRGSSKLLGLPSQVIQHVIKQFLASRAVARRPKLRWRASRGPRRALGWIPFTNQDIQLQPGTGEVFLRSQRFRLWLHRPIEGRIKSGSFAQDARGRWYCNLVCEVPRRRGTGTDEIGIDLGLKTTATCSDGQVLEQARFYRDLEPKLAEAQRKKRKRQVRSIHAKIKNRRKDATHKFSRATVDRARSIAVGDVSPTAMTQTHMAKSVLDAGWAQLKTQLRYKCDRAGVRFIEVDEKYTTQTCSCCRAHTGPKGQAGLAIRRWACSECEAEHDRDVNAAMNIKRLGCETPSPQGLGSPVL